MVKMLFPDWLSKLPDEILHHVLSFLDFLDVVRTCVLSKRWRYVWSSMPCITFNMNSHCERHGYQDPYAFWYFMKSALVLRDHSQINTLCLRLNSHAIKFPQELSLVVCFAAKYKVQRLIISSLDRRPYFDYDRDEELESSLVFPLVLCETLELLELDLGFKVGFWASSPFTSLKSLYLRKVRLASNTIERLLSSDCKRLENVHLDNVEIDSDIESVHISASTIKNLTIVNAYDDGGQSWFSFNTRLLICASNLTSFTYIGQMLYGLTLSNAMSLEHSSIRILEHIARLPSQAFIAMLNSICSHTKYLTLSTLVVKMFSPRFSDSLCEIVEFNNLRYLKLEIRCNFDHVEGLINLLKLSPNVEALHVTIQEGKRISSHHEEGSLLMTNKVIHRGKPWKSKVEDISCLSKHMETIQISYFNGSKTALELVKFLLLNGKILKKIEVSHWNKERKTTSSRKILSFTKASSEVVISFPDNAFEELPWFDIGESDDSDPEED